MRIVDFGASSGIGRELVLQARTGGHHAVAVARSIRSEAAASLTPVKGSVLDPGVAERAVAGADAVAWCVGVRTLGPAFLRKVTVFSEGTRRAIEAMQEAGVSRLAVITGIGAGESRGHCGDAPSARALRATAKTRHDRLLASGASRTHSHRERTPSHHPRKK